MQSKTVVDSAQNKELLWSTLQESGAFAGLMQGQFQPVQAAFDRSVQQAAAAAAASNASLSDVNKHIIREFVQALRSFQTPPHNANNANNANNAIKKKKIELVYRSEDLQNERASEFDRQLREKQAEMDTFLTLKKPTDVNFTDKNNGVPEDKPIGDEMSRLIAQELAARERELVQLKPEDIKKAQQWIGVSNTTEPINNGNNYGNNNGNNYGNNNNNLVPPHKKSVSFLEEEHEIEQSDFPAEHNDTEMFEETASIFSKLKKIKDHVQAPPVVTLQQLYEKLLELEQHMNANHAEILRKLSAVR
jgi:hypothetical protein